MVVYNGSFLVVMGVPDSPRVTTWIRGTPMTLGTTIDEILSEFQPHTWNDVQLCIWNTPIFFELFRVCWPNKYGMIAWDNEHLSFGGMGEKNQPVRPAKCLSVADPPFGFN